MTLINVQETEHSSVLKNVPIQSELVGCTLWNAAMPAKNAHIHTNTIKYNDTRTQIFYRERTRAHINKQAISKSEGTKCNPVQQQTNQWFVLLECIFCSILNFPFILRGWHRAQAIRCQCTIDAKITTTITTRHLISKAATRFVRESKKCWKWLLSRSQGRL